MMAAFSDSAQTLALAFFLGECLHEIFQTLL